MWFSLSVIGWSASLIVFTYKLQLLALDRVLKNTDWIVAAGLCVVSAIAVTAFPMLQDGLTENEQQRMLKYYPAGSLPTFAILAAAAFYRMQIVNFLYSSERIGTSLLISAAALFFFSLSGLVWNDRRKRRRSVNQAINPNYEFI